MEPWDGVINLLAALGVGGFAVHVLLPVRRNRVPSLLEIRFGSLALLLSLFLAMRGLFWLSGFNAFLTVSFIAVSFVPLGILLAVEGLLRRHAPLVLKLFALVGGALCLIATQVFDRSNTLPFSLSLASFQILGLVLPFSWAFLRNREQLSRRENRRVGGLITLTLIGLPFIATDFSDLLTGLPIRLGAIAILMFAYAAVHTARFPQQNPVFSWRALNLILTTFIAAGAFVWLTDLSGWSAYLKLTALILTIGLVLTLALELLNLRDQSEERALLRVLSALDLRRPEAVVSRLTRFSPFEHAWLVRAGRGPVPTNFSIQPGQVYRRTTRSQDPTDRDAAAVLENIGADLLFVLDISTDALCAVEVQDPSLNTEDWANILAALAVAKTPSS